MGNPLNIFVKECLMFIGMIVVSMVALIFGGPYILFAQAVLLFVLALYPPFREMIKSKKQDNATDADDFSEETILIIVRMYRILIMVLYAGVLLLSTALFTIL